MRRLVLGVAVAGLAACPPPPSPVAPPPAPTLVADEADGGSSGEVHLHGTAPGAARVRLFASAACHGLPLALAEPTAFAAGVAVSAVPGLNTFSAQSVGPAGLASACSAAVQVGYDVQRLTPPTITGISPPSPARVSSVLVFGAPSPGCASVELSLWGGPGPPVTAPAEQLSTTGVRLPLPEDSISWLSARCFSNAAGWSSSASALTYVNGTVTLPAPGFASFWPASPASDSAPQVSISVAAATAVAFFASGCDAGSVLALAGVAPVPPLDRASITLKLAMPVSGPDRSSTTVLARASDALGNESDCAVIGTYVVDPSLAPRPPLLTTAGSVPAAGVVTVFVDAQPGAATELFFRPNCAPPVDATLDAGTLWAELALGPSRPPDGGRITVSAWSTTDAGVSGCVNASW